MKISNILSDLGYSREKQVGLMAAIAYYNGFSSFIEFSTDDKRKQRDLSLIQSFYNAHVPKNWKKITSRLHNLKIDEEKLDRRESDAFFKGIIEILMSDVLDYDFPSASSEEIFDWIYSVSNLTMFLGTDKLLQAHNRFELQKNISAEINEDVEDSIVRLLGYAEGREIIAGDIFNFGVIHGATEKALDPRIRLLLNNLKNLKTNESDQYDIFYMSGARGLFNFEESLPEILSEWFVHSCQELASFQEKLKEVISGVLRNTKNTWLGKGDDDHGLNALREEILEAVKHNFTEQTNNLNNFPDNPYGTHDEDKYAEAARMEGRDRTGDVGSTWPTGYDLCVHLIKKIATQNKVSPDFFSITPIISMPHFNNAGKFVVANTEDNLRDYTDYLGDSIDNTNSLFISDLSASKLGPRQALETQLKFFGKYESIFDSANLKWKQFLKPVARQVSMELNLLLPVFKSKVIQNSIEPTSYLDQVKDFCAKNKGTLFAVGSGVLVAGAAYMLSKSNSDVQSNLPGPSLT